MTQASELQVTRIRRESMTAEYGVLLARLASHLQGVELPFGAAVVNVDPGEAIQLHSHHEHEIYFVFMGTGQMAVDTTEFQVASGSLIYISPHRPHMLTNMDDSLLQLIAVWWEQPSV